MRESGCDSPLAFVDRWCAQYGPVMCVHDAPCGLPSGVKLQLHVQPNGLRDIRWNLERGTMMVHVVFALDFFHRSYRYRLKLFSHLMYYQSSCLCWVFRRETRFPGHLFLTIWKCKIIPFSKQKLVQCTTVSNAIKNINNTVDEVCWLLKMFSTCDFSPWSWTMTLSIELDKVNQSSKYN